MTTNPPVYDVCIIGAGVVGCAIARELSRFTLDIVVIEKEDDVSCGASKANSGIVHGGYSPKYGTKKAGLCLAGNRMFARLEDELNFGYRRTGSMVLAFTEPEVSTLRELAANGGRIGVPDLELLTARQIAALEPRVSGDATAALFCPGTGVTSPYEMTIALAENAAANGVTFELDTRVIGIRSGEHFTISAVGSDGHVSKGFEARYLVNASGLHADTITAMVCDPDFRIAPRQGQYIVFEKGYGDLVSSVIFQTPTPKGKGILVTPTYHHNLMIGPNANETESRSNVDTTETVLSDVYAQAVRSVPGIDLTKAITTFAGIRPAPTTGDFIIGESPVPGFFQAAGIESPGLTSSPAIAALMRDTLADSGLELGEKPDFDPYREPIIRPKSFTPKEVNRMIDAPGPERIVCRCEAVSEGEIIDAMERGLPVVSIDAVKRRTRAGQGKCQGGFCRPRVAELLGARLGIPAEKVLERHDASVAGKSRIKARLLALKSANREGEA